MSSIRYIAWKYLFNKLSCLVMLLALAGRTKAYLVKWSTKKRAISASTRCLRLSSNEPYFITTPIYYVNGEPHLGHAYTSVASDIVARFQRNDGKDVYFLTGTDEHGQKVEQSALSAGKSPMAFADDVSSRFRKLTVAMGCSNDDFIRTTEARHLQAVSALWNRLEETGQIYLGAYEGWYSVRDEAFYSESELVNGKAPTGAEVEWVKEESYFFKLSAWTDRLIEYYEAKEDCIGPRGRRNEVMSFVRQEGGLRDLSISRTTFSWGIPVPGNPKHVVYVWLDALTNYITALGYPDMSDGSKFRRYWPAAVHVVGKDILRFHAVFWPAFLMAAGLDPPKRIFAHGWWTKDGEKMSKSVGNVLDPFELLEQYGQDYVRYFLAAEVPFGNDGDFSHEAFANRVNSDLANDVGNLAQRVLTMIQKNCDGVVPAPAAGPDGAPLFTAADLEMMAAAATALQQARQHMELQGLKQTCEAIIEVGKKGNRYIDAQAPWTLRKTDMARFNTVLYVLTEALRGIGILLSPVVPTSSAALLDLIGAPPHLRSFQSIATRMEPGGKILEPKPLFPKIETDNKAISDSAVIEETAPVSVKSEKSEKTLKKQKAVAAAASEAKTWENETLSVAELEAQIVSTGEEVRRLKAEKAEKDQLMPVVDRLLEFKARYKSANNGVAYGLK